MLSSRLKAFVIPTSHSRPTAVASSSESITSTVSPLARTIAAASELRAELRERRQRTEVVGEPGDEEDRAAGGDSEELRARLDRTHGDRRAQPGEEPEEDADPAEARRHPVVPALARRLGDEPVADRRAQERPDDEGGDREGRDRDGRAHVWEG